jgi:predicted peptidase
MNGLVAVAIIILVTASISLASGQRVDTLRARVTIDVKLDYLTFLPRDYDKDPSKKWPLMIFLHGAGERGSEIEKVKTHGPPKIAASNGDFPFILVAPQCPEHRWWEPPTVNALLEKVMAEHRVDPDRVYLTGISMGGYGTWSTAAAYPEKFAAIVPICGSGDPEVAAKLKHVPTWVFHGEKDEVVPIGRSERMVDAIKRAGGDVTFTRYPDATHDSWTVTYDNPKVYEWLLRHTRKRPN